MTDLDDQLLPRTRLTESAKEGLFSEPQRAAPRSWQLSVCGTRATRHVRSAMENDQDDHADTEDSESQFDDDSAFEDMTEVSTSHALLPISHSKLTDVFIPKCGISG